MRPNEAQKCCDELSKLDSDYSADVVKIKCRNSIGHPCGVRITHAPSGNDVGFARDAAEWRYIFSSLLRRLS